MKPYHKINSIFKHDPNTHQFTDEYSTSEIEYLAPCKWQFTEKMDGTNLRVVASYNLINLVTLNTQGGCYKGIGLGLYGSDTLLMGRTNRAQIPKPLVEKLREIFDNNNMLDKLNNTFQYNNDSDFPTIILYGEGYGKNIQKGSKYIENDVGFILFDIKIDNWWLERENVEGIAKSLGLDVVPIIGEGTLDEAIALVKGGLKSTFGDFEAEGIVARPKIFLKTRRGDRIITKVKACDFDVKKK
ncbi:hypothetical protein KAU11_08685 [Candidatus Babeliales bacterium]|nr:hypothetical protein [Candidatus Babeliales bacterium]